MPAGAFEFLKYGIQKNTWGRSPEPRVVIPAGAFEFLKNGIRKKMIWQKAPNLGLSCPQGSLNFSKMASGKNDLGKSPEPRVVMPAGAFEFLKNGIRKKKMIWGKAPNDGLSCPQGPLNFSKMASGKK